MFEFQTLLQHINQREILQRSLIWVAAVAVIGGTVWLAAERFNEQRVKARTNAHVQEIISLLDLESMIEFHQRLDKVRTFINDNSIHKLDPHSGPTMLVRASSLQVCLLMQRGPPSPY